MFVVAGVANPFRVLGRMECDVELMALLMRRLRRDDNVHGLLCGIKQAAKRIEERADEVLRQVHVPEEDEAHV